MILHLQELGQPVHIDRLAGIDGRDTETTDADDIDEDVDQIEDTDSSDDDEDSLKISEVWGDAINDEPGNEAT